MRMTGAKLRKLTGMSIREIAKRLKVSRQAVYDAMRSQSEGNVTWYRLRRLLNEIKAKADTGSDT